MLSIVLSCVAATLVGLVVAIFCYQSLDVRLKELESTGKKSDPFCFYRTVQRLIVRVGMLEYDKKDKIPSEVAILVDWYRGRCGSIPIDVYIQDCPEADFSLNEKLAINILREEQIKKAKSE